jgi:hypothetical protein
MKKVIAGMAVTFMLSMVAMAGEITTMTGYVDDTKCAAVGKKTNQNCAKKCAEAGEKLVFIDDKMQKIMQVSNQDAVKEHAGEHVSLKATKAADGSLEVSEVKTLAEAKAPAGGDMHDHK